MKLTRISSIKIGNRYRQELGDLDALKSSMRRLGLLQPVVIDEDNNLVAGFRRIRAAIELNWKQIKAVRVDIESLIEGEHDENVVRKDFTMTEKVAIADAISAQLGSRRGARSDLENKGSDGTSLPGQGSCAPKKGQESADFAAESAGLGSGATYRRVKDVLASGCDELKAAIDSGKLSPKPAAKVAKLPVPKQKKFLDVLDNKGIGEAMKYLDSAAKAEKATDFPFGANVPRKPEMKDALGAVVPKNLKDTFASSSESLENSVRILQEVRRMVKGLEKWNAWVRPSEMEKKLSELIEDCKNGLPHSVCRNCEGKGCEPCRKEGWIPEWRHDELKLRGK